MELYAILWQVQEKEMSKPNAKEHKYMGKVADLGCVVCRNLGHGPTPASVHHCFYGSGKRENHHLVLPLCPIHHQTGGVGVALHADNKSFYALYGSEIQLLNQVIGEVMK